MRRLLSIACFDIFLKDKKVLFNWQNPYKILALKPKNCTAKSKYYVDSLSENTMRGLRQKVRQGEYPGVAPVGYINDVRTKTIIVNRKKAKIIKKAFELYATGKATLGDISDFLAQHGITLRNGKRVHKDRITFILSNPFYYGHFRYAGEIHEGKHEPIIAKKLLTRYRRF